MSLLAPAISHYSDERSKSRTRAFFPWKSGRPALPPHTQWHRLCRLGIQKQSKRSACHWRVGFADITVACPATVQFVGNRTNVGRTRSQPHAASQIADEAHTLVGICLTFNCKLSDRHDGGHVQLVNCNTASTPSLVTHAAPCSIPLSDELAHTPTTQQHCHASRPQRPATRHRGSLTRCSQDGRAAATTGLAHAVQCILHPTLVARRTS